MLLKCVATTNCSASISLRHGCKDNDNNDLQIAVHARSAGLVLVTNNSLRFERVEGLPVID